MSRLTSFISLIIPLALVVSTQAIAQAPLPATDTTSTKAAIKTKAKNKKDALKKSVKEKKTKIKKKHKKHALKYNSVNINKASLEELVLGLKGIGKKKAKAIIAYRKANGAFKKNDDLLSVKGIGPKLLKKNKDRIRLSGSNTK